MNRIGGRAGICLLLCLLLVGGFGFFVGEYVHKAGSWVLFPGSPHVYSGGNIGCGTVVDRNGALLLDFSGGRTYAPNELLRRATVHWVGDRNGSISAPALPYYAPQMVDYDLVNGVYAYGGAGGQAQLTISSKVQTAALAAMGNYKGTVAVYNYKTGQIICAVTTPNFDPDNLPDLSQDAQDRYEGMYVNRFTQSVYTPGSIFKIVTLAAALEEIPDIREITFRCDGKLQYGADEIVCTGRHGSQNLKTAFRNSCNCAFAQIADLLGREKLQQYADKFGITQPVSFDGITTAEGHFDLKDAAKVSTAWAAIGQYTDQINPCSFLTFVGAIAGGGRGAQMYLVEQIGTGLFKSYSAETTFTDLVLSPQTAETIRSYMRYNVENLYGDENFEGLQVCAKTGTGEVGGGKKPNAMLTGFVAQEQLPLAFIVCVEDGGYGAQVCLPIASKVLSACREAFLP